MIRPATLKDVHTIYQLLMIYAQRGELLSRPYSELYDHLRDFSVFQEPRTGHVLGCCALQFCWENLAEIRSLAVHPDHAGKKIGTRLVTHALEEAQRYDIHRVFTLTYRPGFFQRLDFKEVDRQELPIKIWGGCLNCVKFPDCDEIAMMRLL